MAEYETTSHEGKTIYKHRLLWQEHHGAIPKGKLIHHKNGDKKDNRIENLVLVSKSKHTLAHHEQKLNGSPNNSIGSSGNSPPNQRGLKDF